MSLHDIVCGMMTGHRNKLFEGVFYPPKLSPLRRGNENSIWDMWIYPLWIKEVPRKRHPRPLDSLIV